MSTSGFNLPTDRDVSVRVSKKLIEKISEQLGWTVEETLAALDCGELDEGLYECYIVKHDEGKMCFNPLTMALAKKLVNLMEDLL